MLIGAVPPLMLKTDANPGGLPIESVRRLPGAAGANRAAVLLGSAGRTVLRLQPPGREASEGVIENWWRQGMMGGAKAHYDGIKAFSETDFTEDLKGIDVPTLVMHGDDDQIVPIRRSGPLSAKLVKNGTLKMYPGFPTACAPPTPRPSTPDLLAFIQS